MFVARNLPETESDIRIVHKMSEKGLVHLRKNIIK